MVSISDLAEKAENPFIILGVTVVVILAVLVILSNFFYKDNEDEE